MFNDPRWLALEYGGIEDVPVKPSGAHDRGLGDEPIVLPNVPGMESALQFDEDDEDEEEYEEDQEENDGQWSDTTMIDG